MQCLEVNGTTGALQLVAPQPADLSTCTFVVGSFSETVPEVFRLTPGEGAQIAGAILLVWAVGWVIKSIARSFN